MKKLISLLLALMMVFSLTTAAFATSEDPGTPPQQSTENMKGKITINGVSSENTYKAYKLLDLISFSTAGEGAYSYKVNDAWNGFFATDDALKYVSIDSSGYVTWNDSMDSAADVIAFSKLALDYAKNNNIAPVKTNNDLYITDTTGVFSELDLGYYLVDSSVGALCGLTTTNPNASVNAKNGHPTINKQVEEDSLIGSGSSFGSSNTADIGQIVNYDVTINVAAGAENYVFHDIMDDGLTYQGISSVLHVNTTDNKRTEIPKNWYTIKSKTGKTEITVEETNEETGEVTTKIETKTVETTTDGCTFEIIFDKELCEHLNANDKIVIQYYAMLNRNAVIAGTGNINKAWLDYGEGNHTAEDTTTTYTFSIDIVKTDSQGKLLDGATFKIYDAATGGNEIGVVPLKTDGDTSDKTDSNGNIIYRRARPDEMTAGKNVDITVHDGQATIVGFDNGTYYLEEITPPTGYHKLSSRVQFIINNGNLEAIYNDGVYSSGSGVHVVNKTGTILPETGAKGTAAFITFGVVVMLATGCLLVTRKRLSMIED